MKIKVEKINFQNTRISKKELAFKIACSRAVGIEAVVFDLIDFDEAGKNIKSICNLLKQFKKDGIIQLYVAKDELDDSTCEGAYMLNKFPELPGLLEETSRAVCVKL